MILDMEYTGALYNTALAFGQMNEPPGARLRVALTGLTLAEYFRDVMHQDVLLFIDNIFRFVQAGSEVSALLGRMPSAVGYQPTLATEVGALRAHLLHHGGSITSIRAVYVPADTFPTLPCFDFLPLDATPSFPAPIAETASTRPLTPPVPFAHPRSARRGPGAL